MPEFSLKLKLMILLTAGYNGHAVYRSFCLPPLERGGRVFEQRPVFSSNASQIDLAMMPITKTPVRRYGTASFAIMTDK
jgi:hypothetical protein